jgi:hypothetical protein
VHHRAVEITQPEQYIQRAELGEHGVWYRVLVGPFPDANAAVIACMQLKSPETDCLVRSVAWPGAGAERTAAARISSDPATTAALPPRSPVHGRPVTRLAVSPTAAAPQRPVTRLSVASSLFSAAPVAPGATEVARTLVAGGGGPPPRINHTHTPVRVANGTGRSQKAERVATYLRTRSIVIAGLSNAEHYRHRVTRVRYRPGYITAAEELVQQLGVAAELEEAAQLREPLHVTLGADLLAFDKSLIKS